MGFSHSGNLAIRDCYQKGVTDLFLDLRMKQAIENRGIRLISCKDLAK